MSTSLQSTTWGKKPVIDVSFAYDRRRVGADMQYKIYVTILPLTGASYYGYRIYLNLSLAGAERVNKHLLKAATTSQWSSEITYSSDWFTVSNKTSGTTSLAITMFSDGGEMRNVVYNYNLPVSPAMSTLTASNGVLGTKQNLAVTRYDSTFTHTITYECGGVSGTICTKSTATTVEFTPPLSLAARNTTGSSVTITFTITTYSGNTTIGSTARSITASIPASVVPTVSMALSDAMGYLGVYGGYVQGQSKLSVKLTTGQAYGSAIKSYRITVGSLVFTTNGCTTDALTTAGEITVTASVTDARGRTGTASTKITVIKYTTPTTTSITAARCDASGNLQSGGDHMLVVFSARVTPLSELNGAEYAVEYRQRGSSDVWNSINLSELSGNYAPDSVACILPADTSLAWDVRLSAKDDFCTIPSIVQAVAVAYELIQWDTEISSVSIGQLAVDPHTFTVALDTVLKKSLRLDGAAELNSTDVTVAAPDVWQKGMNISFSMTEELNTPLLALQAIYAQLHGNAVYNVYVAGAEYGSHFGAWIIKTSDSYGRVIVRSYATSTNYDCDYTILNGEWTKL